MMTHATSPSESETRLVRVLLVDDAAQVFATNCDSCWNSPDWFKLWARPGMAWRQSA